MPHSSKPDNSDMPGNGTSGLIESLRDAGQILDVTSNDPLLLHDPDAVWLVDSGAIDVFVLRVESGIPSGNRNNLMRVEQGSAIFGLDLPKDASGIGFIGVSTGKTRLVKVKYEDLSRLAEAADMRKVVLQLLETWVVGMSGHLSYGMERGPVQQASAGQTVQPAEGDRLVPSSGLVCLKFEKGSGLLNSRDNVRITPETGWLCLSTNCWVEAVGESVVSIETLGHAVEESGLKTVIHSFHAPLMDTLLVLSGLLDREAHDRIEEREKEFERTFEQSLARQSALLDAKARARMAIDAKGDTLLAACQIIGRKLGVQFKDPPGHAGSDKFKDPVGAIARASRVRCRDVELTSFWWKKNHGPLLGFLQYDNRPVALMPVSARRYIMVDPQTNSSVKVTPEIAGRLKPMAYMFYKPLHSGVVTGREVLSFSFKGNGGDIAMVICMGVLGGILGLLTPMITKLIFGTIIPAGEVSQLWQIGAGLLVAGIASAIFGLTQAFALIRIEGKSDNALQAAIWDRLLTLPVSFYRQYTAGDLANRVTGINSIRQIISGTVMTSILSGVFSVFNLILIIYYSWKLAILAVILVLIAGLVTYIIALIKLKYQRVSLNLQGHLSGIVLQLISAVAKLRDTACEARAFANWSDMFVRKKEVDIKTRLAANSESSFNAFFPIFCTLCTFAVYYFFLKDDKDMTTSRFLAYNAAFSQFMAALLGMSGSLITLVTIRPVYERAKPIFTALPEVDGEKADPGELKGSIEVKHVSFRYDADGGEILRDVCMLVNPGEFIAIVGPSGAGKSTLFRLLLGFETPVSGEIYFDGQDLRMLDPHALRRQLSVVLQNGQVFSGDIYHNIIGASRLSIDDAWVAARAAALDEDIKSMPMGMYTYISEGGATLSGGQRQRLMIARAIATRPRVVFFDEATSSLDNTTQAIVSKSLDDMNATRIVIAQRLSTVMHADRIYVIEKGQVAQTGTYKELMEQDGLFKRLAQRQMA